MTKGRWHPPLPALVLKLVAGALAAGCAAAPHPARESLKLARPRLSSDSVVLEVGFFHVPAEDRDWLERFWQETDEQQIEAQTRRHLRDNGLRCGIVGVQLPDLLREAIDRSREGNLLESASSNPPASADGWNSRRLHIRAGRRNEIVASSRPEGMVLLTHDGETVRGSSYPQAQGVFALRVFPRGDGSVRLELIPEIHHGAVRPRFVGRDGAFFVEARPDGVTFDDLRIDTILSTGQTFAITAAGPSKSLGGNFFLTPDSDQTHQKLLLIRLAQSQFDDLFAPEAVPGPLAAPPPSEP